MGVKNIICAAGPLILFAVTISACNGTAGVGDLTITATEFPNAPADQPAPTAAAPTEGATATADAPREAKVIDATTTVPKSNSTAPSATFDRSAFIVPATNGALAANATEPSPPDSPPAEPEPSQPAPLEWPEGCFDTAPVADVTIPDGSSIDAGQAFTKIWRLRNSGSCDWDAALGELHWAFVEGEQMNGPDQVPILDPVPVGSETDIQVELTAPAVPGLYEGRWQAQGPDGEPFGVVFWVLIEVPSDDAAAPQATPVVPPGAAAGGAPQTEGTDLGQEIWQLINGERDRQGLYQLAYNPKLAAAAQKHAQDCSQRGECSHTGSDGSDEAVRVQRENYQGSVDEAWSWSASPANAVAWWLDEVPPNDWHRRMLLSTYLREVGVGVAPAPNGGHFFVAVFGVPGH